MRKHKIKQERPDGSSGHRWEMQQDLTYCIHDRVELLHQVFSLLGPEEIKAMAPDCVKDISMDDLQELCLEELLGISSKRLLSSLDGAAPPSDTESSSDDSEARRRRQNLDTISLDSISSDEGALSTGKGSEKSKKRKQCKRRDKRRRSSKNKASAAAGGERELAAGRAGITVLEVLELQARARAIRAQLNAEIERKNAAAAAAAPPTVVSASDDDVEIKEEAPEVVELGSSDEEKPILVHLQATAAERPADQPEPPASAAAVNQTEDASRTVTKRSDLTIIIPKAAAARKIKLNRQKFVTVTLKSDTDCATNNTVTATSSSILPSIEQNGTQKEPEHRNRQLAGPVTVIQKPDTPKKKDRVKKSKKSKRAIDADGSDQDEITLQLSDSEKMDLLEDFDRKTYDRVSSSSEDDCEDSSDSASQPESSKSVVVAADSDRQVTRDNVEKVAVMSKNGDHDSIAHHNSNNASVAHHHEQPNDDANNSLAANDYQTRDDKVDVELKSGEELPVEYGTGPNTNENRANDDVEKTVDGDSDKTVKSVDDKSAVMEENSTDVQKSIEDTNNHQQRPDSVIESHAIIIVADENNVKTLSEDVSTVIQEENKSNATIEDVAPPEAVKDSASEINTVASGVVTFDGETTHKSKAKKKIKKNEKKEKKQKKKKKSKD